MRRWFAPPIALRDDIPTIIAPGCRGQFGGHLDPGEPPEWALRRERLEAIAFAATDLPFWFSDANPKRIAHFFRLPLTVPRQALPLPEGQELVLARLEALNSGPIWSPRLSRLGLQAPLLRCTMKRLRSAPQWS